MDDDVDISDAPALSSNCLEDNTEWLSSRYRQRVPEVITLDSSDEDEDDVDEHGSSFAQSTSQQESSSGTRAPDGLVDNQPSTSGAYIHQKDTSDLEESSDNEDDEENYIPGEDEDIWVSSGSELVEEEEKKMEPEKKKAKKSTTKRSRSTTSPPSAGNVPDDSDYEAFKQRLSSLPKVENDFKHIGGFQLDRATYNKLYDFQKEGLKWMLKLHQQCVGGILADEMGLGKTIQTIVFLRAIEQSNNNNLSLRCKGLGRSLIVCPATLLKQWVEEFKVWFPECRVLVLHSTSSHTGGTRALYKNLNTKTKDYPHGGVLITTYATYVKNSEAINNMIWHFAILDEGHNIKNADTKAAHAVRELTTPNRFILTGSPIQNNLKELWALIDFIYPGKLGELNSFQDKFIRPITNGSYIGSSNQAKDAAYQCTLVLQEAVRPYILRRLKKDVNIELTKKEEKVLFCNLTAYQRRLYEEFLLSKEVDDILKGDLDPFYGISRLAHLCNHPHIYAGLDKNSDEYGNYHESGKMILMMELLKHWWPQKGTKVLIFSQKKTVLDILGTLFDKRGWGYCRMDGDTPIGQRDRLVKKFSNDPEKFIFLLTTRVGGVGLNLVAANKIIIFDPDWNPTTDQQARERSWRIGQKRDVMIFRLVLAGTIEEKIYMRQVHKEFLANRILKDSRAKQVIPREMLRELFRLAPAGLRGTEAGIYFDGETLPMNKIEEMSKSEPDSEEPGKKRKRKKKKKISKSEVSQFEDKQFLEHILDKEMFTSIVSHDDVVRDEGAAMISKSKAKEVAARAAKSLLHSVDRKEAQWAEKFDAKFDLNNRKVDKTQKAEVSSFWNVVNKTMKINDGQDELDDKLRLAQDLRMRLIANDGKLTTTKIYQYFQEEIRGINAYFFKEMLNKIASYKSATKSYTIRDKYRRRENV